MNSVILNWVINYNENGWNKNSYNKNGYNKNGSRKISQWTLILRAIGAKVKQMLANIW